MVTYDEFDVDEEDDYGQCCVVDPELDHSSTIWSTSATSPFIMIGYTSFNKAGEASAEMPFVSIATLTSASLLLSLFGGDLVHLD